MKSSPLAPAHPLVLGESVSGFSLETLDGKTRSLLHLQGPHGTVLVFFSTLCACSRTSIPRISTLVETCKSRGIRVYGVAIGESRTMVRRYLADHPVDYPVLIDPAGRVADDYGIASTPTLVGINAGGVVRILDSRIPPDADAIVRHLAGEAAAPRVPPERRRTITRDSLLDKIQTGIPLTLVDVQPPKDFHRAHIRGAINIPLEQIGSLHDQLDPGTPVVTVGSSPSASRLAADRLILLGFRDVLDYAGGITEWLEAGLPFETGAPVCFITREELLAMWRLRSDLHLVDVRPASSYAEAHIARAVNIPLEELERRAAPLDREALVVVYDYSFSSRGSTQAALKLTAFGFKHVHDYKGGLRDWKDNGLPLEGQKTGASGPGTESAAPGTAPPDGDDDADSRACCS